MATTTNKDEALLWSRVNEQDKQIAAVVTDIRGIYAGLDEIRDVLVRLQEGNKPNIGGLFLALLATCGFLVTIGTLTMTPVYRDLTRMYQVQDKVLDAIATIQTSRFTEKDAELLEDKLRKEVSEVHRDATKVMQQHEIVATENTERIARLEGYIDGYLKGAGK